MGHNDAAKQNGHDTYKVWKSEEKKISQPANSERKVGKTNEKKKKRKKKVNVAKRRVLERQTDRQT